MPLAVKLVGVVLYKLAYITRLSFDAWLHAARTAALRLASLALAVSQDATAGTPCRPLASSPTAAPRERCPSLVETEAFLPSKTAGKRKRGPAGVRWEGRGRSKVLSNDAQRRLDSALLSCRPLPLNFEGFHFVVLFVLPKIKLRDDVLDVQLKFS